MSSTRTVFLTAEWRDLVMLNYEVDLRLLDKYVPSGTVLDSFQGKTYVSLVGFRFCKTKLFGTLAVPFHTDFDEVNLRFYVRRKENTDTRRGVVFIAEIVPKRIVAATARLLYGENYVRLPMGNRLVAGQARGRVEYRWKIKKRWCALTAEASGAPAPPKDGSLEQFITEHYWGYSCGHRGGTLEYHVSHEPWSVWTSNTAGLEGDVSSLYGIEFGAILQQSPQSAFIADGSPAEVFKGVKIVKENRSPRPGQ